MQLSCEQALAVFISISNGMTIPQLIKYKRYKNYSVFIRKKPSLKPIRMSGLCLPQPQKYFRGLTKSLEFLSNKPAIYNNFTPPHIQIQQPVGSQFPLLDLCLLQNDSGNTVEEELWNGLYKGHAYSITGVLEVNLKATINPYCILLV